MSHILHITRPTEWHAAQQTGSYRGDTLDSQGFIHCSTVEQVVRVANAVFRGQTGLILLVIETEKVTAEVKFEPPIDLHTGQPEPHTSDLFPHIYGALNVEAVVKVVDFFPEADGTFTLPEGI